MRTFIFTMECGRLGSRTGKPTGIAFSLGVTILAALPAVAQQHQIDLKTQGKNIDFSGAPMTRPIKTGTVLPAACGTGEMFFKSNAPAGANLFGCVAANTWQLQSGGSLPDVTGQSGAVLSNNGATVQWSGFAGDVTGAPGSNSVVRLQGRNIAATAPANGQALAWNAGGQQWEPQTISGGGGGASALTVKSGTSVVGTRGTLNLMAGSALTMVGTDTGSEIEVQYLADTAVLETKANAQTGLSAYCVSADGSPSVYSCNLSPVLSSYTTGMRLYWKPDVTNSGAVTLNVDLLGPAPVVRADGAAMQAGDAQAGVMQPLWYDGTSFRQMSAASSGGTTLGPLSRVWCPLGNCFINRDLRASVVAARTYFYRLAPDRSRLVRRLGIPLFPWNGATDTLAMGVYGSDGVKIAECNTAASGVNVSGGFPVCALPSAVTLNMDTEYLLVVASQTASPQLDCTGDGPAYELHTLWGAQSGYFPASKALAGHGAGVATGTGASFTLPANLGAETGGAYCRPQFVAFPQ